MSVGHSPNEGERYGISEPARLTRKSHVLLLEVEIGFVLPFGPAPPPFSSMRQIVDVNDRGKFTTKPMCHPAITGRLLSSLILRTHAWDRYGLKPWIEAAAVRLPRMKLVIALANKLARIAWGVLVGGRNFEVMVRSAQVR